MGDLGQQTLNLVHGPARRGHAVVAQAADAEHETQLHDPGEFARVLAHGHETTLHGHAGLAQVQRGAHGVIETHRALEAVVRVPVGGEQGELHASADPARANRAAISGVTWLPFVMSCTVFTRAHRRSISSTASRRSKGSPPVRVTCVAPVSSSAFDIMAHCAAVSSAPRG